MHNSVKLYLKKCSVLITFVNNQINFGLIRPSVVQDYTCVVYDTCTCSLKSLFKSWAIFTFSGVFLNFFI